MLRRLKLTYALYNLLHRSALRHNVDKYRKLGLRKSYFSPVSSQDFVGVDPAPLRPAVPPPAPDPAQLAAFGREGYLILPGFADGGTVDRINREIEAMLADGRLTFRYRNKLMFAVRKSAFLAEFWNDPELLRLLDALIGGRAKLFQSINFLHGSEQRTHSDSIHMTTFPLGGLLGVWLALEDIGADNGPLHYYPGSHTLPYLLNGDYGNTGTALTIGDQPYTAYEDVLAERIAAGDLEKKVFHARKGDLFIWHANLLHGGEPHTNPDRTRRSMVNHYFDANRVCYHEVTQRPALFETGPNR